MPYALTKLAGLRWRVICPDKSTFNTSSLVEALEFMRKHIEAALKSAEYDGGKTNG